MAAAIGRPQGARVLAGRARSSAIDWGFASSGVSMASEPLVQVEYRDR
jgi:hypothetical protein